MRSAKIVRKMVQAAEPISTSDEFRDCVTCQSRPRNGFCNLALPDLKDLQQIRHGGVYATGTSLYDEENLAPGIFVICSGRVKLSVSSQEGKTLVVRTAVAGEVLGLQSTISGGSCCVGARTIEPCYLSFISRKDFLHFVHHHRDACVRVIEQLSYRCAEIRREIGNLYLSTSAGAKLAKLLMLWSSQQGQAVTPEPRIEIRLTHDEIAERIDTARETVSRLLIELKKHKIMEIIGPIAVIRNKPVLKAIASGRLILRRARTGWDERDAIRRAAIKSETPPFTMPKD